MRSKNKYKLNIYKKYDVGVAIKNKHNFMCNAAYDYITECSSFKKAYESCGHYGWINTLMRFIERDDLTLKTWRHDKKLKLKEDFDKLELTEQVKLLTQWRKEWAMYIEKVMPWREVKKALIEHEIIIKMK